MIGKETYEQYQSRIGEAGVRVVLKSLGNLDLVKLSERKGKRTPDYEIKDSEGNTIAFCEVKSLVDTLVHTDSEPDVTHEDLAVLSKKRDKNHRSKLRQHLHSAISQLEDYVHLPTIVVFISFDMTDYIDMANVLEEYKELYSEDVIPDSFILMKVHQGIVPSETFEIRQTVRILYNSDRGKEFGEKYLDTEDAARRAGLLPLTFSL